MAVKTLDELFEHELKDIYYAEHRLVDALTELAGETKHREIKRAYATHKKETQGQIKRLKQVFKMIGDLPETEKCPGIEGLLKEKQNFTRKEKPSQEILDYYNLGAASKTERYEITAYEGLIEIARQLGLDDAVELLAANLQEEEATLDILKTLSQGFDTEALMADEEEEPAAASSSKRSAGKGASKSGTASKSAASKSGSSKSVASKDRSASRSGAASRKSAASKSAASKSAASKSVASKRTASSGRGKASRTGGGSTAGNRTRSTAGLRRNDAGAPARAADDAGYRGEVEADDIMVAPDPVVTAGER